MAKIFGIGLNKTATYSLSKALTILKFNSLHYWSPKHKNLIAKVILDNGLNGRPLFLGLHEYDAFTDFFIPSTTKIFKMLDRTYPNSKFILTVRDLDAWLASREQHVRANRRKTDYKRGWLTIDKKAWCREWHAHTSNVTDYFKHRPDDLLIMDICSGDGWNKLCPFLGVPIPDEPFPHENIRTPDR